MQHRMTQISIKNDGVDSEAFRTAVGAHLDVMSLDGWELVSTDLAQTAGMLTNKSASELMLFWKRP